MDDSNKQGVIPIVDRASEIKEHYRPMLYIDLLEHSQRLNKDNNGFDDLTKKILDLGGTMERPELSEFATVPVINSESVTNINTVYKDIQIYVSKESDSTPLTNCELMEYAAGVVATGDTEPPLSLLDKFVKVKSYHKPSREEAVTQLINLASITGANAIVLDQKASFGDKEGYTIAGQFYIKR